MMPQIKHIMKKISLNKKTKNDIILTASLLLLAVLVFFIMGLITKDGSYVEVKKDGAVIGKYSLSIDREIEIKNDSGYNILKIESGKAYISEASCPDKLCVKQGRVFGNGKTLVCLPNKTVITVYSNKEEEVDFIS